jgi:SAM-dependent methyltransferase
MGDINQRLYLQQRIPNVSGAVLEVGSKDYGSTTSLRDVYVGAEYVGIDMEEGTGVDAIVDLTEGTGTLPKGYFDLAICCSVLEHVRRPWVFSDHLASLVKPGGHLYISAPWVWRYHAYPDDYWRFSWRGIEELFPGFEWGERLYSTNVPGEFFPAAKGEDDKRHAMKAIGEGKERKYLPYLCTNMLGRKL